MKSYWDSSKFNAKCLGLLIGWGASVTNIWFLLQNILTFQNGMKAAQPHKRCVLRNSIKCKLTNSKFIRWHHLSPPFSTTHGCAVTNAIEFLMVFIFYSLDSSFVLLVTLISPNITCWQNDSLRSTLRAREIQKLKEKKMLKEVKNK